MGFPRLTEYNHTTKTGGEAWYRLPEKINAIADYLETLVLALTWSFLQLADTPDSYAGEGGKVVKVKELEDGLEFAEEETGVTPATPGQMLKAGADGLPANASNTDTEVASAVTLKHTRKHDINGTDDHNGVAAAVEDNFISFSAAGLPKDSGKKAADLSVKRVMIYVVPSLSSNYSGNIHIELKGFNSIDESGATSLDTATSQIDFYIFSGQSYEAFPSGGMPSVFEAAVCVNSDIIASTYIKWRAKDKDGNYLTNWIAGEITFGNQESARAYDVTETVFGKPDASAMVMRFEAVRSFTLPQGMAGSRASASVAATASAAFLLKKNGSTISTFTFAIGATVATFSDPATDETIVPGDILTVIAPSSQDATLSTISWTFRGEL